VSVARRRTIKVLTSGVLFVVVALVAGFVFAGFPDNWVLAVVATLVVAALVVEWICDCRVAIRKEKIPRRTGG
jgi:hypothetical protein